MTSELKLEPAELPADAIEVGRIADAWGVKGWFKVLPYSSDPEALFKARRWFLQPSERGARTFAGTAQLSIRQVKDHSDSVVAWAEGIDDRNAAEALRGARIFIERSSFPAAQADEYYWVDLIGLQVLNRDGALLGTVADLLDTGAHSVLRVDRPDGDAGEQRLIPFVGAYIDDVDLASRRITVDWGLDY